MTPITHRHPVARDRRRRALRGIAALLAAALLAAGCGGGDDGSGVGAPREGEKGGTLEVLAAGDFKSIDPGEAFYQFDYMLVSATQRPLYSYEPDELEQASPDLAASPPVVSDGGTTVTVRLRRGVRFSPPVDREVTAEDVKYAIERAFTTAVPNGYVPTYFDVIEGAPSPGQRRAKDIPGIEVTDSHTLVFRLSQPSGGFVKALAMPVTAPVPEEYARRFDRSTPSKYGRHQVATGPYMIENDRKGRVTGYKPGRSMRLVRNPSWRADGDFRPAYADRIEFSLGNEDTTVASRRILSGESLLNGDFIPDPPVLKQAVERFPEQIAFAPIGSRYIALNTTIAPLDDLNVRKAIVAATDRNALALTRGGAVVGDVASHFLTPGQPGFEQAGGMEGPDLDFIAEPGGDPQLAAEYLRRAGYRSGRYTGDERLLMVGDDEGVGARTAEVFQAQLRRLGFKVTLRQVPHEQMYARYCNVPAAKVAICPNVGWLPDFADGQAMLEPTFSGESIVPENNSNWPQLDVPAINQAMDNARRFNDPEQRAEAWGAIDRLIMAQAPAVPWLWDKQANISSKNVHGVIARWNGQWDLSYSFVKQ